MNLSDADIVLRRASTMASILCRRWGELLKNRKDDVVCECVLALVETNDMKGSDYRGTFWYAYGRATAALMKQRVLPRGSWKPTATNFDLLRAEADIVNGRVKAFQNVW